MLYQHELATRKPIVPVAHFYQTSTFDVKGQSNFPKQLDNIPEEAEANEDSRNTQDQVTQRNEKLEDSFNKYEDQLELSDLEDVACFKNKEELAATGENLIKKQIEAQTKEQNQAME